MEKSRRTFIKKAIRAASGIVVLGNNSHLFSSCIARSTKTEGLEVFIPMPLQVVIDDVGWWSGEDGSKIQEPYRTGINRKHVPADYKAIAHLGRSLGIRPQAAFILCEWDKENILRKVPTSTWMGDKWDNSKWVGPWLDEAAEIIRNNREYFEVTIHGIGHEYWQEGTFTRAEWTDSQGQMRPQEQVELHLEYFEKLMYQHNLGPLPESFVPAAFRHSFGPSEGRDISLAQILEKHGVNYINTPFSSVYNKERIENEHFGFDSGVITIDRGNDEFQWLVFPADPKAELKGPTCGMHWPNMLHPDPERNNEVVQRWIEYLKPYNEKYDTILAPDSVYLQKQLAHHSLTGVKILKNSIELDFTETDKLPSSFGKAELTIKIITEKASKFQSDNINIDSVKLSKGDKFLYTLKISRKESLTKAYVNIG